LLLLTAFFIVEDRAGGFWWLDGEVVLLTLGFLIINLFFRFRKQLIERYGAAAYPLAFKRYAAPGLALIVAIVARMRFIPGPMIPRLRWYPLLPPLGWLLVAAGVLLWLRAVRSLGVDSLTMSYVYFPRDGDLARHAVYAFMRHPVYAAAQWIGWGLALINGSWFALTLAAVFTLEIWGWIRLVEEKELIERFGTAYAGYRREVPAFLPSPAMLGGFLKFLILGR
jgi:protein-S-isoprenylcysteine O-methyltransferase Ste14